MAQERKYVPKARHYVPLERRHVTATSFKRGVSVMKRPTVSRAGVREIVKKPMLYGKPASQAEKPVKKILPRKPSAAKIEESTTKSTKVPTTSKVEEDDREPPSVEPTPDGHYELSPMLGKMVEAELQGVMMKVWELTPTNPQDAAEEIVLDRFKNKAGEALRNTLGLNITKRLLNVHNPLYVKMVFSGKPLRADLVAFLKQYNITAFKRVGERGGTFAAKMRSFHDFDNLCTDKNLKCGKIRVVVTPCYQFMTCPPNLRTPYDGKEAGSHNDVASNKPLQATVSLEINKPTEKSTVQQNTSSQLNVTKVAQTNVVVKATQSKVPENQTELAKMNPKVTPAKVENKPAVKAAETKSSNVTETAASKLIPIKPPVASQPQDSAKKSQVQENPTSAAPTIKTNQNSAPKVNSMPIQAQAQNSSQKATPAKVTTPQNSTPKVTPAQATQNCQNTAKTIPKVATPTKVTQAQNSATKVLPGKPTQNSQNPTNTTPKQVAATPSKPAAPKNPKMLTKVSAPKPTPAKIAGNKPKVATKTKVSPKKKQSDFDELSDHDILALISEGIVLDECSGSDVD